MRSASNLLFVNFCLGLLVVLVYVNGYFQDYFGDAKKYLQLSQNLRIENEREKLRTSLAQNRLLDLQQDIAAVLPSTPLRFSKRSEYQLKQMVSVLRIPAASEGVDTSSVLMEKGRQELKEHRFEPAISLFKKVIDEYPTSTQVVEAHFLLGESYFQAQKFEESLDIVHEMMNHFPENELTGYLMLRNAQILLKRNRAPEATEFYRVILKTFPESRALRTQTVQLLNST